MSDSTYGRIFRVTTWGESHGPAIGAVIDGCPAGLPLTADKLQAMLDRRKPGQSRYTTKRNESDTCRILSGTFEGLTTGTPISVIVENTDQRSRDYGAIAELFRPGHADYTYYKKYGIRDYRGGGRSSARETIGRVIGGAVAMEILSAFGITVRAYASSIGPVTVPADKIDLSKIEDNPLRMPLADTSEAEAFLEHCLSSNDSAGGTITCLIEGCPAGLGSPVFGKLDAALSAGVMSIGAIKGIEFGEGFRAAELLGSENNDAFCIDENGSITTKTNHAGGILGGISSGQPIIFRCAVKPTPSISQTQETVSVSGKETPITITGRHDPCIVPRAVVVVEAMAAITIADALLENTTSSVDSIKKSIQ